MLKNELTLETVTFSDDYTPELSGYGEELKVVIEYHNVERKQGSITVKIGDLWLFPQQLEEIIKEINFYKKAIMLEVE